MKRSLLIISKLQIALLHALLIQVIVFVNYSNAQLTIQWQNTILGSSNDLLFAAQQTNDPHGAVDSHVPELFPHIHFSVQQVAEAAKERSDRPEGASGRA